MAIRSRKPTSPGRRFQTSSDFSEITKKEPEKSLLEPLTKKAGRNNQGRITVRLGTALRLGSCSIGWWVGPSSPRPIESWVKM